MGRSRSGVRLGSDRDWPNALRLGVVLCVSELVLTRVSAREPVAGITVAVSVVAFLVLSGVPALLFDFVPLPPRLRFALHRLSGWGLCTLVGLGIVGPAINEAAGSKAALGSVVVLLAGIAALSRLSQEAPPRPYPRPSAVGIYLALAAVAAWLVGPGSLPALPALLALVVSGAVIAALASRNRLVLPAGLLGIVLASLPSLPTQVPWADRARGQGPDILLISVDALRFDAALPMGVYQKIASEGVEFTSAQAPAPWTLPSIASLLTGVPPSIHGAGAQAEGVRSGVAPSAPALARDLAALGYDTVGLIAPNPFAGASFGMDRGFDYFYQPGWSPYALPRGKENLAACPLLVRISEKLSKHILCRSIDGAGLTDHALDVLAQRRDRPLFLWIHYLDVHLPYVHTVNPTVSAAVRTVVTGDFYAELAKIRSRPGLREELWAANEDEVRFVDGQAQRIVDAFGERPRVTVLTADHGEELFEHGGVEHGHALFQEVIQIPLVISGLKRAPGVSPEPVTLVDVTKTLLAAAGGNDPLMMGVDLAGDIPDSRLLRSGNMLRVAPDRMFTIRRGWWKAITDEELPAALFDLQSDPGELHNLAADQSGIYRELMEGQPRESLGGGAAVELSEEQRARLEALGYVGE